MLRWSIATVCMGGALEGQARGGGQGRIPRRRNLRKRPDLLQRQAARGARTWRPISASKSSRCSRCAILKRCRSAIRARNFERAARKFDLMHELGTRLLCLCSNVSEEAIYDRRARRRGSRRTRRPRPPARLSASATRRWPGDDMSRTGPGLGHRASRRPRPISASCSTVSISAVRAQSDRTDRRAAGRSHRAGTGRRRAGDSDGSRCR